MNSPETRPKQHVGAALMAALESYLFAELVWYILHDGDQRLYEFVIEQYPRIRDGFIHRAQVLHTLYLIRRLPER